MAFQDTWRALRPTDPQIRTSALHPLWSMIPCHPLLSAGVPSAPSGGILSLSVPGTSGLCYAGRDPLSVLEIGTLPRRTYPSPSGEFVNNPEISAGGQHPPARPQATTLAVSLRSPSPWMWRVFTSRDGVLQVLLVERAEDPVQRSACPTGWVREAGRGSGSGRSPGSWPRRRICRTAPGTWSNLGATRAPDRDPRMRVGANAKSGNRG